MARSLLVIWNPNARLGEERDAVQRELERRPDRVRFVEPDSTEASTRLAREATRTEFDLLIAAGGDGTVNAAAQGLIGRPDAPPLGILPLGTGNDLCRTLAIPPDPLEAIRVVVPEGAFLPTLRTIDVIELRTATQRRYVVNMATGGNSSRVLEHSGEEVKDRWGAFAYLRGAVDVVTEPTVYRITLQADGRASESFRAFNVIIGNGRSSGGGLRVAPYADPEDGLLDAVVMLEGTPMELAAAVGQLLLGDGLSHERIVYRQTPRVRIESDPPLPFTVDGDVVTEEPATFTVRPRALEVVVGPEYTPEPPADRSERE